MNETTKTIHFKSALVGEEWIDDPVFSVDSNGMITNIATASANQQVSESFDAVALPGMPNVHSHAFQRAFAGLSEFRTADNDSFWTWRKLMYDFLLKLSPEDVYVIARQLYIEMLLAGYTWVGEFHYVHNDIQGNHYACLSELSDAVIRAANDVGIGICMLPVLYQRGGFDDQPLSKGQQRFQLGNEDFLKLFEDLSSHKSDNFNLGIALHSLRAVCVDSAKHVIDNIPGDFKIHVHVAEQTKEIEDCLAKHSKRSVQFLLDHFDVDQRWCLIHATHLDDAEVSGIAKSGAVVGLCPTTEANLGDGIFRAKDYLDAGGKISIGSDSHCSVDLREELRILEYGQRLQGRNRAVLGTSEKSVGRRLYQSTAAGGGQAIGVKTGSLQTGFRADFTIVDPNHPAIAGANGNALIDRLIFCNADDPIVGAIVGGQVKMMDDPEFFEVVQQSHIDFNTVSRRLMT